MFNFSKFKHEVPEGDLIEDVPKENVQVPEGEVPEGEVPEGDLIEEITLNFDEDFFKKGDFVRIIYKKGSFRNMYKGYFGEIKSYFKGSGQATIALEALNSSTPIVFPIGHFIKRYFLKEKEDALKRKNAFKKEMH
jgi:hypothetical protein